MQVQELSFCKSYLFLNLILLVASACTKAPLPPAYEEEYVSVSGTILDIKRESARGEFSRRNILAQFTQFQETAKTRPYRMQRLTIAPNRNSLLAITRSDFCSVGLARYPDFWEQMDGAQLVVFQGSATGYVKLGNRVEKILLPETLGIADRVLVDGDEFTLSGFQFRQLGGGRDGILIWAVGHETPQVESTRRLLGRLLELTGMRWGTVMLRRDFFFGTSGGPYLDIFRSPTRTYIADGDAIRFAECTRDDFGERCAVGSDECFKSNGPRAFP